MMDFPSLLDTFDGWFNFQEAILSSRSAFFKNPEIRPLVQGTIPMWPLQCAFQDCGCDTIVQAP